MARYTVRSPNGKTHLMQIEVRDENGPVLQAKFVFAVDRNRPPSKLARPIRPHRCRAFRGRAAAGGGPVRTDGGAFLLGPVNPRPGAVSPTD